MLGLLWRYMKIRNLMTRLSGMIQAGATLILKLLVSCQLGAFEPPLQEQALRASSQSHHNSNASSEAYQRHLASPGYCALSTTKHSVVASPGVPNQKYFVYNPQMGMNNQIQALSNAAHWASILHRTLVIPHIFFPRASAADFKDTRDWIQYNELFDAAGLNSVYPGLEFVYATVSFMQALAPSHLISVDAKRPVFDTLQDGYFKAFGWEGIHGVDLRKSVRLNDDRHIVGTFGGCEHGALVLDSLFYLRPRRSSSKDREVWRQLTRPSLPVQALVAAGVDFVKQAGSSEAYTCMHIRLGDFSSMCAAADNAEYEWLKKMKQLGFHCEVDSGLIKSALKSLPGRQPILLLSDDIDKARKLFVHQPDHPLVTSDDLKRIIASSVLDDRPSLMLALSAVVEQAVCAQASNLWVNRFSTFSRGIAMMSDDSTSVHFW